MSNKDNGGPAFPGGKGAGDVWVTLRDYFAAKAMQAQLTYGQCKDMSAEGIALYAYEYADAMLQERSK